MNIKKHLSAVLSALLILAIVLVTSAPIFAEDTAESLLADGWRYFNGDGVPKDQGKGIGLMVDAANAGSVDAMLQVGYFCAYGFGPYIVENFEEGTEADLALSWFTKVAESGDADNAGAAMIDLGYSYLLGDESASIPENPAAAFRFFDKAEQIGVYSSNDILGIFYTYGSIVDQNADRALEIFMEGAKAGFKDCENAAEQYAYSYYSGNDFLLDINFGTAFKYYQALTELDNPRAMYNLGMLYLYGLGVSPDRDVAIEWIKKSADAGFDVAQEMLPKLTADLESSASAS